MRRSEFLKLLKEQLPELREAVNKQQQIFGFELEQLTKRAQRAIHDGDRERFEICIRLAEKAYLEGDERFKRSIDTIFMENLEYVTPAHSHYWAWEMTPACLQELYVRFWGLGKVPERPQIT